MTRLDRIEQDVANLSRSELAEFRAWFETFEAERFDKAVADDAEAGELDALAEAALAEHKRGRTRPLRGTTRPPPSGTPTTRFRSRPANWTTGTSRC